MKVRVDQGQWQEVETYVASHSEVDFSHSICPGCYGLHVSPLMKES